MNIDYGVLLCPGCGETNLHHDCIDICERPEDAETGLHVRVMGGDVAWNDDGERSPARRTFLVDDCMDSNPSGRRQGLSVWFWCESCRHRSQLTIAQHKGSTFIEFLTEEQIKQRDEDSKLGVAERLRRLSKAIERAPER